MFFPAVVRDDMITFGYDQGMEIRDLRLNTKAINDIFQVHRTTCGRGTRLSIAAPE